MPPGTGATNPTSVPPALTEHYHGLGIGLLQVYGLTESCGPACLTSPETAVTKAGSTGKAFLHTDVKVVGDDGSESFLDCDDIVLAMSERVLAATVDAAHRPPLDWPANGRPSLQTVLAPFHDRRW